MGAESRDSSSSENQSRSKQALLRIGAIVALAAILAVVDLYDGHNLGWSLFGAGLAVLFVPSEWLTAARLTGKQVKLEHPEVAWLGWVFPLTQVLWILSFFAVLALPDAKLGPLAGYSERDGAEQLFGGTFTASLAILSGLFGIFTGVYPELRYRRGYRYTFDVRVRPVSLIQTVLALVVVVATLAALGQ